MTKNEHEHKDDLIKPGNKEYLSYYIQQEEWKPTEPTGKIEALISNPGPATVYLPSTIGDQNYDPTKSKAPAFKFGEKETKQTFSCGLGPAAYNISRKTNKGIDTCHAPKIGEILKGLKEFHSPGPAAHHRGTSDKYVFTKMPAYTMRLKSESKKHFVSPDPLAYTLPETLGPGRSPFKGSPAYTIAERLRMAKRETNPGPAAYKLPPNYVNKPRCPAFSMRRKENMEKIGIISPGPASNDIHLVKFHKPATPRFSFGIRHTPFKAFQKFAAED